MSELVVTGLSKTLGGRTVMNEVSFQARDKEFIVVLGPSGSGKSTLLKLICGLERPDVGTILLNGRDITQLPSRERNLGMVFQDYGLYPAMNVFDNIAYGLQARNVPKTEIDKRVPQAAQTLGLGDFLKRSITDLSGGEQQRVALARALAKDADCYLYDEPLSNLDPKLRFKARRDILEVHRLKGQPSLYVTHDQEEAFAMADKILLFGAGGVLLQIGTPDALLHEPASLAVARFMGSPPMNLLEARLERGAPHYLITEGGRLALSEKWQKSLEAFPGHRVVLGIRPEALRPVEPDQALIQGEVVSVEELIGELEAIVKLGSNTHLRLLSQNDDVRLEPGQQLCLTFDDDALCLFGSESERAITMT
jgi:multiple sugar transport system ATP-binding protein